MRIGPQELIIILVIVLLLFGGTKLAGLGKAAGRSIREFKEETKDLKAEDAQKAVTEGSLTEVPVQAPATQVAQPSVVQPVQPPQVGQSL